MSVSPNLWAILIGIDYYLPNRLPDGGSYHSLRGCVHDVNQVEAFLRRTLGIKDDHIVKLTATNTGAVQPPEPSDQWPTYENIVAAFREVTDLAHSGDTVYIHCSCHGGRAPTIFPERKGALGLDEALVPLDIGNPTARYLRDLELVKLVNDMVVKGLVVTVVLDSCHSGGMTRGSADVTVRGIASIDTTKRPTASLVDTPAVLIECWDQATESGTRKATVGSGWLPEPRGYTLLAACRPSESAHEYAFDGTERNGALTYWLLNTLESTGISVSYKDLHDRIVLQIHGQFENQTPQLQGEGDRFFLGSGRVQPVYAVSVLEVDQPGQRLLLGAGQAQGIRTNAQFAIYPPSADHTQPEQRQMVVRVTQIEATTAWATFAERFSEQPVLLGAQAVLLGAGNIRLVQKIALVHQDGPPASIDQASALQAIRQAWPTNGWVEEAEPRGHVDYNVVVNAQGCYEIWDRTGYPIANLRPTVAITVADAPETIVRRLIHLAKYNAVRQLSNSDPRSPLARQLEVELVGRCGDYDHTEPFEPEQPLAEPGRTPTLMVGEWTGLRIRNGTHKRLNVTVFDLQPDWGISQVYPQGAGDYFVEFEPGEEQIIPLRANLPDGYAEGRDVVKVFATVEPSTFRWLELPALDEVSRYNAEMISRSPQNPLEQLLASLLNDRPPTRHMSPIAYPGYDWIARQVEVAIRRVPETQQQMRPEKTVTPEKLFVFNGIDGDTGGYDLPPMSTRDLIRLIRGEASPDNLTELRVRARQVTDNIRGAKEGVNPRDLAASGWGVIFPSYPRTDPDWEAKERLVEEIREALQPLLQLRSKDTRGRLPEWVQGKGTGYRVGADTKNSYLERHGVGPGPVDPDKVPYYLLIVGSPSDIPYRFQTQLDVQYAVGRIHFETIREYANYAASVVAVEAGSIRRPREAAFFRVANEDDDATRRSASQLVGPLARGLEVGYPDWRIQSIPPVQATKATLTSLLGGARTPSLLFTASHGMKFARGSDRQLPHQGALLCQDWPGPQEWRQTIPQDFYFAGDDLTANADLLGLIAFFFACYGAGTPQFNEFARNDYSGVATYTKEMIAEQPFMARLPVTMLSRPRGALAVVGHVERAWSYSFDWGNAGTQTTVFESTLRRLLDGHPLGSALEFFNQRYAELSTMLNDALEEIDGGKRYEPFELAGIWTANNDARGYTIIGDPAVRLL